MTKRLHSLQTALPARATLRALLSLLALAVLITPSFQTTHGQTRTPLDPPDLGCPPEDQRPCNSLTIALCGGGWGGAPNGFTVQYQTAADFATFGWPAGYGTTSSAPSFCNLEFTGPSWQLGQYQCVDFVFGSGEPYPSGVSASCPNNPLLPNTEYVFRAFAHESSTMTPSPWGGTLRCSTAFDCPPPGPGTGEGDGCTFTQGYWKNHGPGSKHGNQWPISSFLLGANNYTDLQMLRILNQPTRGNGLVSLARQLIAAKLNIANGASNESILSTITAADQLIAGQLIPPIGNGFLSPAQTSELTDALADFNEGITGPGHCDDE